MTFLVVFILGMGVGLLLNRWRPWGRQSKPISPETAVVKPASGAPAPEPSDLTGRLQPLRAAIDTFGKTASHPRDLRGRVEFIRAVELLSDPSVSVATLIDYACGANWAISCAAFAALSQRPDGATASKALLERLKETGGWEVYYALDYVAKLPVRPPVGSVLLRPADHWEHNPMVVSFFVDHFQQREALGDTADFGGALAGLTSDDFDGIDELLLRIAHPFAKTLLDELRSWRLNTLNRDYLATVGRFWTADEDALLIEHALISESILSCEAALTASTARSVLLVGEARTGKTSVARCAARRLATRGFSVFEASAAELMAGQIYIGELEGRVRRIVDELSIGKRVVWFVPSLLQLATSGAYRGQTATILDQVLPAMIAGRLVLLSECTPSGLTVLQQRWPVLRTCMEVLRLPPITRQAIAPIAQEFAARVGRQQGVTIEAPVVPLALQLAAQYLSALQLPGSVLDLLKLASNWTVANGAASLSRESLLGALSQATGLPRAILDDNEKIELAAIRRYFDQRVIGQSEAVSAVVERIAMLKAGLTDPSRPVAVFLFAGPTGTGKTELAKTLAEYLFGNVDRMLRLDMSELQAPESIRKIIGAAGDEAESESLIHKVRKQPFSVILLDEFEKAHQNVWDLFLQVFDDGRLTDAAGQTADFRQTYIVMTSNIGARAHEGGGVGFAPGSDQFAGQQIMRAVASSFRPEFVNRLDKVIVFQPLNREHMRAILQKELKRLLERRGLKNREWAVEWESSALDFLLDRGFNAQMGARPLKRAIEQYVVAPLASNIVEHRFPSGEQFLFVRGTGDGIEVEFVDPDAKDTGEVPDPSDAVAAGAGNSEAARLSKDLANRLALQLFLLECGIDDASRGPPREVLLAVEPVLEAAGDKGSTAQWSAEIAHMYRTWAKARRMQMHEVPGPAGSTVLAINGFGAEPRLLQEVGLHVLETESAGPNSVANPPRAAVRVSASTRELAQSADQRIAPPMNLPHTAMRSATVVRRYRFGSAPLVRDAIANWRSGRVKEVMAGNFDLLGIVADGSVQP
ncbi:MAG TPA: AAA family ATPase [Steroidobacteraceae bacterium]|jgi:ATP-dependent Clp protease ATP-binding subunit ClpC|nr:AAA family ATPase [Steroidobacteraceae bacterium]